MNNSKIIDRIDSILNNIFEKNSISYEEAEFLIELDTNNEEHMNKLFYGANELRKYFCGEEFELCTIMNIKSGKCSEDCIYCAQSSHYSTSTSEYPLLKKEEIVKEALKNEILGIDRFSLVSSGKGINSKKELETLSNIYIYLKTNTNKIELCASHGIIDLNQAIQLKKVGVTTYHHNIETSKKYFPKLCTTHTYQDRIQTIKNCKKAGLRICSGCILGVGESRKDRLNIAFELKKLGVDSVPINILTPIKGTPLETKESLSSMEILKTIAIFRYILPNISIKYAGGRQQLKNFEKVGFTAGINSALTGDFLTTIGSSVEEDKKNIRVAGFNI